MPELPRPIQWPLASWLAVGSMSTTSVLNQIMMTLPCQDFYGRHCLQHKPSSLYTGRTHGHFLANGQVTSAFHRPLPLMALSIIGQDTVLPMFLVNNIDNGVRRNKERLFASCRGVHTVSLTTCVKHCIVLSTLGAQHTTTPALLLEEANRVMCV